MDSSTEYRSQIVLIDQRKTMRALSYSFSSSSTSRSLKSPLSSPNYPATPLHSFSVPFSWEYLPGIPKKQAPDLDKDKESSSSSSSSSLRLLVPLPPSTAPIPTKSRSFDLRKKTIIGRCQKDPFIYALLECSKDDDPSCRGGGFWTGARLSRSLSNRLGFMNAYTSCKGSCAVSDSIICLLSTGRVQAQSEFL